MNIYDQAVLEGVATSFSQTEEIIENGKVTGITATDVQKIKPETRMGVHSGQGCCCQPF